LLSIWSLLVAVAVAVNHLQMLAEAEVALEVYLLDMLVLHLALLTRLLLVLEVLAAQEVIHLLVMEHQAQTQFLALYPLQVVVLVLLEAELLALVALVEGRALALRRIPVLEFLVKVTLVARLRQLVQVAAVEARVL
jgi:hypothetical protein